MPHVASLPTAVLAACALHLLAGGAAAVAGDQDPSSGVVLEGWDDLVFDGPRPPGFVELRLNLGGDGWDNLRQSPPSASPERTAAARSEARLTCRLFRGLPVKSYVEAGQVRYDGRPATAAYGAGLGFDGDRHAVHFSTRLERRRPSIDIGVGGDVLHDALLLRLRYGLRTSRLEGWAGADRVQQHYSEAAFRNGRLLAMQTGISYLGLSRRLTPELAAGWSQNEASGDSDFDFRQRRVSLGLRCTPTRALALTGRLEYSMVVWGVTRPGAPNFGRQDRRRYWGLQGQIRLTPQTAWTVAFDRLVSDSTRANRDFTASSVATGLTLRLGSTSSPPSVGPRRPGPSPAALLPPPAPSTAATRPSSESVPAVEPVTVVAVVDRAASGLRKIETRRRGPATETTIHSEGLLSYSTLSLGAPLRFVVDLVGVSADAFTVAADTDLVRGIRVAPFRPAPSSVARVVFDLNVPVVAEVERDGAALHVRLRAQTAHASAGHPSW